MSLTWLVDNMKQGIHGNTKIIVMLTMMLMLYFYKEYQNACYMIKISVDWDLFHTINLLEGKG